MSGPQPAVTEQLLRAWRQAGTSTHLLPWGPAPSGFKRPDRGHTGGGQEPALCPVCWFQHPVPGSK